MSTDQELLVPCFLNYRWDGESRDSFNEAQMTDKYGQLLWPQWICEWLLRRLCDCNTGDEIWEKFVECSHPCGCSCHVLVVKNTFVSIEHLLTVRNRLIDELLSIITLGNIPACGCGMQCSDKQCGARTVWNNRIADDWEDRKHYDDGTHSLKYDAAPVEITPQLITEEPIPSTSKRKQPHDYKDRTSIKRSKATQIINFASTTSLHSNLQLHLYLEHREWAATYSPGAYNIQSMTSQENRDNPKFFITAWKVPEDSKRHFYRLLQKYEKKHFINWVGWEPEDESMGMALFFDVDLKWKDVCSISTGDPILSINGAPIQSNIDLPRWIMAKLKNFLEPHLGYRPPITITEGREDPRKEKSPLYISHHVHVWGIFLRIAQMRFVREYLVSQALEELSIPIDSCVCGKKNCDLPKCGLGVQWNTMFDKNVYKANLVQLRTLTALKAIRGPLDRDQINPLPHRVMIEAYQLEEDRMVCVDPDFADHIIATDITRTGRLTESICHVKCTTKNRSGTSSRVTIESSPRDVQSAVSFMNTILGCPVTGLKKREDRKDQATLYFLATQTRACPRHKKEHNSATVYGVFSPSSRRLTISCHHASGRTGILSRNPNQQWLLMRDVFIPQDTARLICHKAISEVTNEHMTAFVKLLARIDSGLSKGHKLTGQQWILHERGASSRWCIRKQKLHAAHWARLHITIPSYKYGGKYYMRWTYHCLHPTCNTDKPIVFTWRAKELCMQGMPKSFTVSGSVMHHDLEPLDCLTSLLIPAGKEIQIAGTNIHPSLRFYRLTPEYDLRWTPPDSVTVEHDTPYLPYIPLETKHTTVFIVGPMGRGKTVAGTTMAREAQRLLHHPVLKQQGTSKELLFLVCRVAHCKNLLAKLNSKIQHYAFQDCKWDLLLDDCEKLEIEIRSLGIPYEKDLLPVMNKVMEYVELRGTGCSYEDACNMVITIHSLRQFGRSWEPYPFVAIDETSKVFLDLIRSDILSEYRMRVLNVVTKLIREARWVILMDADMDQWLYDFMAKIRDPTKFVIHRCSVPTNQTKRCLVVSDSDLVVGCLARTLNGQEGVFFYDSRTRCNHDCQKYLKPVVGSLSKVLVYSSATPQVEKDTMLHPDAAMKSYDTMCATPCAFTGMDIRRPLDFTYSDFCGTTAHYLECAQAPARARSCDTHWITLRNIHHTEYLPATTSAVDEFLRSHEHYGTSSKSPASVGNNSNASQQSAVDIYNEQNPWTAVWIHSEILRRQHHNDFAGYLVAAIEKNGVPVYALHPTSYMHWLRHNATLPRFDDITDDPRVVEAQLILAAPIIDHITAARIQIDGIKTNEWHMLLRYNIAENIGPLHFPVSWYALMGTADKYPHWRKWRLFCMTKDARKDLYSKMEKEEFGLNTMILRHQIELLRGMMDCLGIVVGTNFEIRTGEQVAESTWSKLLAQIKRAYGVRCQASSVLRRHALTQFIKWFKKTFGVLCSLCPAKVQQRRINDLKIKVYPYHWKGNEKVMSTLSCWLERHQEHHDYFESWVSKPDIGPVSSTPTHSENQLGAIFTT